MKYTFFACFFLLWFNTYSQQTAVTKDGKTVLLNDDGTWKYVIDVDQVKLPDSSLKKYSKPTLAKTLLASERTDHGVWYNPSKWTLMDIKPSEASEYFLKLKNEDGYCITVTEKIEIPLDNFKNIVVKNMEMRGVNSIEFQKEEYRIVNNVKVLHLEFSTKVQGINLLYSGYYFSNESGTSQILCYTSTNLFKQYKNEFENILNGFVVTKKD